MVEISAFGQTLRRVREERGVPLDAVAGATRIARHHLDALERGDLESLPSGPFGRSYLRAYAEFLGIDPAPVLESYRSQEARKGLGPAENRDRAIRELSRLLVRPPKPRRLRLSPVLGVVVLASALYAVWFASRGPIPWRPHEQEPSAEKPAAAAPESVTGLELESEPPPAKEPSRAIAISVSESALGTDVINHALIGRATRFSEGERVLFWTRVLAAKPGEVIHHYWLYEGRAVMRAVLRIGGPHWRTFSRYTLPDGSSGTWVVEARDEAGRVLAREEFHCRARGE